MLTRLKDARLLKTMRVPSKEEGRRTRSTARMPPSIDEIVPFFHKLTRILDKPGLKRDPFLISPFSSLFPFTSFSSEQSC